MIVLAGAYTGISPMLLGWILLNLRAQYFQSADQARARFFRFNHFVDLAHVGGAVGVEELLAIFADKFRLGRSSIFGR